jgi:hypothetical protein
MNLNEAQLNIRVPNFLKQTNYEHGQSRKNFAWDLWSPDPVNAFHQYCKDKAKFPRLNCAITMMEMMLSGKLVMCGEKNKNPKIPDCGSLSTPLNFCQHTFWCAVKFLFSFQIYLFSSRKAAQYANEGFKVFLLETLLFPKQFKNHSFSHILSSCHRP